MWPSPNLYDETSVYWIVGAGLAQRHATGVLPGALPDGEWIPVLCQRWIRVPFCTPWGRTPGSVEITDRCPDCARIAEENRYHGVVWDS